MTIGSASENGFVYQLHGGSWLGATDEIQEGTWVWVTGESWGFTNWDAGEPNNGCCRPGESISENGVAFVPGATWNDGPQDQPHPFVCEWEPVSP